MESNVELRDWLLRGTSTTRTTVEGKINDKSSRGVLQVWYDWNARMIENFRSPSSIWWATLASIGSVRDRTIMERQDFEPWRKMECQIGSEMKSYHRRFDELLLHPLVLCATEWSRKDRISNRVEKLNVKSDPKLRAINSFGQNCTWMATKRLSLRKKETHRG